MSRVTGKSYFVFAKNAVPEVNEGASWTQNGAAPNIGAELDNNEAHPTGGVPEATKWITSSSATSKLEGLFNMPTLKADEVIIPASVKFYVSRELGVETAGVFSFGLTGGEVVNTTAPKTKKWEEVAPFTSNNVVHKMGTAKRREELKWVIKKLKTTAAKVFEICLFFETTTEDALIGDRLWGVEQKSTSVAEGKFTTATTSNTVGKGQPLLLLVSTNSGQGASTVSDTGFNNWTKDAEAHIGTEGTLQVWRTTSAVEEKVTITLEGLKTGDKLTLHGTEYLGTISALRSASAATNTSIAVVGASTATRPAQGDCVLFALWTRRKEKGKDFVPTAPLIEPVAAATNGTAEPEFVVGVYGYKPTEQPAEATTVTPEGSLVESELWLALTLNYKPLVAPFEVVPTTSAFQALNKAASF